MPAACHRTRPRGAAILAAALLPTPRHKSAERSGPGRRFARGSARLLAIAAALASAAAPPDPPARAEDPAPLYRWRDQDGGVHYTPDPARIPEAHRHTQERVEPGPLGGTSAPAPAVSRPAPPLPGGAAPSRPLRAEPRPALRAATRDRDDAASEPTRTGWAVQLRATPAALAGEPLPAVELQPGERLYRTQARIRGEPWTRLRVGVFPTRSAAQAALGRLARDFPGAWVTPVSATEPMRRAAGWAIQLRAVPPAEDPGPPPSLALPPGTRLYWTRSERAGREWRRLRLGDFPTLAAARAALALVAREFPEAWIAPAGEPEDPKTAPALPSPL